MTYAHLDLKPFNLEKVKRIYIDDPKLWDVFGMFLLTLNFFFVAFFSSVFSLVGTRNCIFFKVVCN